MQSDGIRKNALAELTVDSVAFGGAGVARSDGLVVFVERALPGDRVMARITRRKPQYAEARVEELLAPGPDRVTPPCEVFGACGGCKWQHFAYAAQTAVKQGHVAEALGHIGGIGRPDDSSGYEMLPIVPSPDQWNYRNKMEFSFGWTDLPAPVEGADWSQPLTPRRIAIGFHRSGDFRRIVDVPECHIQPHVLNRVLRFAREVLNEHALEEGPGFAPYDNRRHDGFLRHLVLRHSATTGRFLCVLLTAGGPWKGARRFADELMERFPQCAGFTWGINDSLSDVARMDRAALSVGEGTLIETLGTKTFRVSPFSFFQTNTRGAAALYDVVAGFAALTGTERVLDAYCGTGTIGLYLADRAREVVGVELSEDAVRDARHNAEVNGATNCVFHAGDMKMVLQVLRGEPFDLVIVDPPRGGMDNKALKLILALQAPVIVYVSCNPTTLARDAREMSEAGYDAVTARPVDMFPHTFHVESVIKFRRRPE